MPTRNARGALVAALKRQRRGLGWQTNSATRRRALPSSWFYRACRRHRCPAVDAQGQREGRRGGRWEFAIVARLATPDCPGEWLTNKRPARDWMRSTARNSVPDVSQRRAREAAAL